MSPTGKSYFQLCRHSGTELRPSGTSSIAISPDGEHVAYIARQGNFRQLYLRALDELEGKPIDGTEGARMPFFSPDSQWLGFKAGRKLLKVALSGGAPQAVVEVSISSAEACWTSEKEIVFNTDSGQGLSRISSDGGEPKILTTPDHGQHEEIHRDAEPLP